jgi:hypothetical protein
MSPAVRSQADVGEAGSDLVHFAIGFIVLQSIILALFYCSRYAQAKQISGIEMKFFMPLGYLFCVGNAIMAIRKSTKPTWLERNQASWNVLYLLAQCL